jgi:uncharacterized protein (DUF2236 family)
MRPLLEFANFVTVGLLPPTLRCQYGLHWDGARELMLCVSAEYAKRLVLPALPPTIRYDRPRRGRAVVKGPCLPEMASAHSHQRQRLG